MIGKVRVRNALDEAKNRSCDTSVITDIISVEQMFRLADEKEEFKKLTNLQDQEALEEEE